jgi:ribose transport system permease protein
MEAATNVSPQETPARVILVRHRGLITGLAVLAVLVLIVLSVSTNALSYYDVAQIVTSGTAISILAMGQALVVLTGGFDLSAAAAVSLVNVSLASLPVGAVTSPVLLCLIGIGIGIAVGVVNGFFVACLRLQPIVVTLATMFILQGITLLIMPTPGGMIDGSLGNWFFSDLIPGLLPMSGAVILLCLAFWYWLRRTPFGLAVYAVGGDAESAYSSGLKSSRIIFATYVLAGAFYGLAGVCISAQTGAGDPLVGNPMLLQMFAAVVVGGTLLGGGRGGLTGSIVGAFVLVLTVNILLILNVSAYYSTIAESSILLLAVLLGAIHRRSVAAQNLSRLISRVKAWREGALVSQLTIPRKALALPMFEGTAMAAARVSFSEWFSRNRAAIMIVLPAYLSVVAIVLVTQMVLGRTLMNGNYYNTVLMLSSFLAVLALGQGCVILTGGLDLSLPWVIALSGILVSSLSAGSNEALLFAVPVALAAGCAIGFLNGAGIVFLGLSPFVMTLAMNGILQGTALLYSNGTPDGFAAPALRQFMSAKVLGVTPVVLFMALFVVFAILLTTRTAFGRRIYAIGNSERAAVLSGINVKSTILWVYVLSGFCGALVGILLSGLAGQASLGMGDDYLLPSIAAVVIGGTLITGGRGTYVGMLGGVLLLTTLQTLLAGTTLPTSTRSIVYGLVILGAVVALRERRR